jgi:hypothetical protein
MNNAEVCRWLLDNADAPIRYRVWRELLKDEKAAKETEAALLDNSVVKEWLRNLKPETPPQHWSMEHGSFDFCLENALLKCVQLGLHCGLPQVADAAGYYIDKVTAAASGGLYRQNSGFSLGTVNYGFYAILISNFMTLADSKNNVVQKCMLGSLDELYRFAREGDYDIYASSEERAGLKAVPKIWKNKKFIRRRLVEEYGFCYPFIYDIVGLHKLYGISKETDRKIDAVIGYISTDAFHHAISDGYGILISGDKKYHAQGWDPKYPGWFGIADTMENSGASKLLFFAQHISKYPPARKTKWFAELLRYLENYKTPSGTYIFPAGWLKEQQGYAVLGSHLAFGENRKKKNWREIESTFYVQLLTQNM